MKFCHSLLSGPYLNKGLADLEALIWMSAISVENLHRFGQAIVLYADETSINLMKKFISYDDFIEIKKEDFIPSDCYAASKFYAMKLMDLEDIHIDNDVFIGTEACLDLLTKNDADLVTQLTYKIGQPKFEAARNAINYLRIIGLVSNNMQFDKGYNAGIMCIRNKEFKEAYINSYFDFLKSNEEDLKLIRRKDIIVDSFNEEVRLYLMSMHSNFQLKIFSLLGDVSETGMNQNLQERAELIGYEHLCGPKIPFLEMFRNKMKVMNYDRYQIITKELNNLLTNLFI
jgi:hypothetical protein